MVGLKISSEEIEAIIPILGLTDEEQGKVYLSLLSLGMATLGQISLLSGLDYIKAREALHVLEGSKLVKRIPGKVGRYVALEPFLKAFFLAYDPITLVNIRKEASSAFKENIKQISDIFTNTNENVHKQIKNLDDDFTQSLSPIKLDFNELTESYRKTTETSGNEIQKSIEELKNKIQHVIENFDSKNREIKQVNLSNLEKIPSIFEAYTKNVTQNFDMLSESTNNDLEKVRGEYKADFEALINKIEDEIGKYTKNIDEIFNEFESKRLDEEKAFNDKIEEVNSLLKDLMS
ncbi:MAG: helix-turn-helix domain-containing protein, partial [Promethearchaeota archaeon]